MSGYKLLLVPDNQIKESPADQLIGMAWTTAAGRGHGLSCHGPFTVIADVGEDKRIRMSRQVYGEIEVVEPPF